MTLSTAMFLTLLGTGAPAADWLEPLLAQAVMTQAPAGSTRAEVGKHRETIPAGCTVKAAEMLGRLRGSGQAVFRLSGAGASGRSCTGWSWAGVRIFELAWVVSADVAFGAPLATSLNRMERELPLGHSFVQALAPDAVAASALRAGTAIEPELVRSPGQISGRPVAVELRSGDLVVATTGEAVPCQTSAVCARLSSGKRVTGTWADGRLEVVLP